MAHKHAAVKAIRKAKKHREQNDARRRTVEILLRQYRKAVAGGLASETSGLLPKLVQAIDKAAQRHVFAKNAAARMKSRLMRATARKGV